MPMPRPTIKTPCVAHRYAHPRERIAEFSTPSGKGGLISVSENVHGAAIVDVYRCDPGVIVLTEDVARLAAAAGRFIAATRTQGICDEAYEAAETELENVLERLRRPEPRRDRSDLRATRNAEA